MRAQTVSLSGRRKKKLERQVEKYIDTLKTHQSDYKVHIDLGDTYAELHESDRSIEAYRGAIALLHKAPALEKTRQQIVELHEKIIELAPGDYQGYIDLSEAYINAGHKEKAYRFLLTSAKKAYEEEHYELALECYKQAIARGRSNPHIVERCTELYIQLGRTSEAMENYLHIGDMYAQEEKNIEALEYYKKACALEPGNPELLLKVARMYNAMAWTENAAAELVKVGAYYEHNQEYTEALRYYNYSVRLDPENERAQEGRGRINQSPELDGLVLTDDADANFGDIQPDGLTSATSPDGVENGMESLLPEQAQDAGGDDAESGSQPLLLDETIMLDHDAPAADLAETLWLSPDSDGETHLLGGHDHAEDDAQPSMNLFLLDDEAYADGGRNAADGSETDVFGAAESPERAATARIEPSMLPMRDAAGDTASDEVSLDDLRVFIDEQTDDMDGEAGTLFLSDPELDERESAEALPLDDNALPPTSDAARPADTTASPISLEDWIIDLKEDELVELALEEALREQEQEAAANWEELLGLAPSQDHDPLADTVMLSLPDQADIETEPHEAAGGDDMILDIDAAANSNEITLEVEHGQSLEELVESSDDNGLGLFLDTEDAGGDEEPIGMPPAEWPESSAPDTRLEPPELPGLPESPDLPAPSDEVAHDADALDHAALIDDVEALSSEVAEVEAAAPESAATPDAISEDSTAQPEESLEMQQLFKESGIEELFDAHERARAADGSADSEGEVQTLYQRIDDLEQQLERTEEEKYFLQERFASQISQHKAHEESLQREIADVYRDKAELEKQLVTPDDAPPPDSPEIESPTPEPAPIKPVADGPEAAGFDNQRYEALLNKISAKKERLQKQLRAVLKKREENGRSFHQELDALSETKQRLQHNLASIQQAKTRIEKKVAVELRQAQETVATLTQTTKSLESQVTAQRRQERELRKELARLRQEKEGLETEFATTIGELQQEKTELEEQVSHIGQAKQKIERTLKKKLHTLHRSYQQLKREYTTVIELKDAQLAEHSRKLTDVTSKYKKLETVLAEIRKERARLKTRLHQEAAMREALEGKLVKIEAHVDALDAQEITLANQLSHELDRYFTQEQQASSKFHLSLDDLEGLLALQEREIHTLEAV